MNIVLLLISNVNVDFHFIKKSLLNNNAEKKFIYSDNLGDLTIEKGRYKSKMDFNYLC